MDFTIEVENYEQKGVGRIVILQLCGPVDQKSVQIFENMIQDFYRKDICRLILDLSKTKYLNSTGLGLLINIAHKVNVIGGGIRLVNVEEKFRVLFDMLGLDACLPIFDEKQDALGSFGEGEIVPLSGSDVETPSIEEPTQSEEPEVEEEKATPDEPKPEEEEEVQEEMSFEEGSFHMPGTQTEESLSEKAEESTPKEAEEKSGVQYGGFLDQAIADEDDIEQLEKGEETKESEEKSGVQYGGFLDEAIADEEDIEQLEKSEEAPNVGTTFEGSLNAEESPGVGTTFEGSLTEEAKAEEPTETKTEEPTEAKAEEPTEAKAEEPTEAKAEEFTEAKAEEPKKPTEAKAEEPKEKVSVEKPRTTTKKVPKKVKKELEDEEPIAIAKSSIPLPTIKPAQKKGTVKKLKKTMALEMQQKQAKSAPAPVREVNLDMVVYYYEKMESGKTFNTPVKISKISFGEDNQVYKLQEPMITIVPRFPGCQVTPDKANINVQSKELNVEFWVTPSSVGELPGWFEICYAGKIRNTFKTPFKILNHNTAKTCTGLMFLMLLLPIYLVNPETKFLESLGGWTTAPLAMAGILLAVAIISFLRTRSETKYLKKAFRMKMR